jgi:hypothetical protein
MEEKPVFLKKKTISVALPSPAPSAVIAWLSK